MLHIKNLSKNLQKIIFSIIINADFIIEILL